MLTHADRLWVGAGGVCALLALSFLTVPTAFCQTAPAEATPHAGKADIRIAGPANVQSLVDALAEEFRKSQAVPGNGPTMEYLCQDAAIAAAKAVLSGHDDMMLCWGQLSEKDIAGLGQLWKELAPEQHVIGARAVAIVVHVGNSVDSLTREQLETVFSGKALTWRAVGGEWAQIQRYGLLSSDPLTKCFEERFPPAAHSQITRKKTSAEVLAAIPNDPGAVAYVDAAAASTGGGQAKTLSIGGVAPDVQSIKDGTYPFAEVLVFYVSPNASPRAKEFAQFILAGKGDAVFRQCGFVPTLRAVRENALAGFQKLYGPDIARVKATPDPGDDVELAVQILKSARTTQPDAELLPAMCGAAYDLGFNASGGETAAFEALCIMSEKVPGKKFECAQKRVALYERTYSSNCSKAVGASLVDALMANAEQETSCRRYAAAADILRRAQSVAEQIDSANLGVIKERQRIAVGRVDLARKAWALAEWLHYDPKDAEARATLRMLHLVELDDPAEAVKFLDAGADETTKANLPLAIQPVETLSEESALNLAEWYAGLAAKADTAGKELMVAHARGCYLRFFAVHKNRKDELATRATLGFERIGGAVPSAPVAGAKPQPVPPPKTTLMSGEEIFDLKLADLVGSNPDVTQLGFQEIGTARQIMDVRPLARLTRLTTLELRQVGGVKDLSPIGRLSSLASLTLTGLTINNVSALAGLSNLTALDLSEAKSLSDLTPVSRLTQLRTLTLANCSSVADLSPLASLPNLTSLTLSGCEKIVDLSPIEKLSARLTTLNLAGCSGVTDVYAVSKCAGLKALDLRGCRSVAPADIDWLQKQLPGCRILRGPIAP